RSRRPKPWSAIPRESGTWDEVTHFDEHMKPGSCHGQQPPAVLTRVLLHQDTVALPMRESPLWTMAPDHRTRGEQMHRRTLVLGVLAAAAAVLVGTQIASARTDAPGPRSADCQFANGIKRVVVLDFDNVHLTRDIPNVPSDLEQMPHLLNFLKD